MPTHTGSHECRSDGYGTGCTGTSAPWCYDRKCYNFTEYQELVQIAAAEEEVAAEVELSDEESTILYITYSSEESDALLKRFGSSTSAEELIQNFIDTQVAELAATTMQIEYNFKKSKFQTLSEKNLSAFETDEAAQDIDIETTMVATTAKSDTSY